MHELSIAQAVIDHVIRSVPHKDLQHVRVVRLRVGEMAGIVTDSLDFSFMAATRGTSLENAVLEFECCPFILQCRDCGERTSNVLGITVCERCGSSNTSIESGAELDIVHLELNDPVPL